MINKAFMSRIFIACLLLFPVAVIAAENTSEVRSLLSQAELLIDQAGRALDGVDQSVAQATDNIVIWEGDTVFLEGFPITPIVEEPDNWQLVYLPNLTTTAPGWKRYRYLHRDSDRALWRSGYLFPTEEAATAAAEAIAAILKRVSGL